MTARERREQIRRAIEEAGEPVTASVLAARFSVSRQVVVGDVALLRAAGCPVAATPRGYVAARAGDTSALYRSVACVHGPGDTRRELELIVDNGCGVVNVVVEHPLYGQLEGSLELNSRYDVDQFCARLARGEAKLLSELTGGVHLHTLRCPDAAACARVLAALEKEGFLYPD